MIPMGVRIFVCTEPVDMRYGFDRLAQLARDRVGQDPVEGGALFVFAGRSATRLKVLWFDRNGLCLLYKRLHQAGALGTAAPSTPAPPPPETPVAAHTRVKPTGRKPLPEKLPRIEIEVLPSEVQQKGTDAFVRIGEDVTETVERRPASLVVVQVLELAPLNWKKTLEHKDTQQRLDANVFRRATLGLLGDHRPTK